MINAIQQPHCRARHDLLVNNVDLPVGHRLDGFKTRFIRDELDCGLVHGTGLGQIDINFPTARQNVLLTIIGDIGVSHRFCVCRDIDPAGGFKGKDRHRIRRKSFHFVVDGFKIDPFFSGLGIGQ